MIVSAAENDLRVAAVAHTVADDTSAAEIKNGAGHGSQFSAGDQRCIDWGIAACRNGQPMLEYTLRRTFARQVEDRVIRDVYYGRCVRGGIIVDGQGARFVERISGPDVKCSGIALVARGTGEFHRDAGDGTLLHPGDTPNLLVEPTRATMQRIGLVIHMTIDTFCRRAQIVRRRCDWRTGRP